MYINVYNVFIDYLNIYIYIYVYICCYSVIIYKCLQCIYRISKYIYIYMYIYAVIYNMYN